MSQNMAASRGFAPPDALKKILHEASLRATPARLVVLAHLRRSASPVSHAELVANVADSGFDRATIYRNLMDLTRAGLVSRVDRGDHVWRFTLSRGADHDRTHPHFVCVTCGDVECLPEANLAIRPAENLPRAVRTDTVEVQLRGICDRC
jgi:Fur family ferric uptake transcriptional regulator